MAVRDGLEKIGNVIDGAFPAPQIGETPGFDDELEPEFPLLPPGCPVEPLGKLGQICFFLDEARQFIALPPEKVNKHHIRNMFGRKSGLCDEYWPRLDDKGRPKGPNEWKPEVASDALMRACAFKGIFNPQGRVRGRGAHLGAGRELILHCGDTVFISGKGYEAPGLIDNFVYPAAEAMMRPDAEAATTAPAEWLLQLIKSWAWFRPLVDPMLLLGWIVAATAGGALKWRPHAWVTGSTATGKSTLQEMLELLFAGGALPTGDASSAALRQLLKQQTLPVFFDELEAEEDNRKNSEVVKLARLASSGAVVLRGGQDHQGHEFVVRSCFLFSSILLPPMLTQDRNRLAILELADLPANAKPPILSDSELKAVGRALRRRLVDQWPRFEATLQAYKLALQKRGHGGRGQSQFGTLLACADLVLYDFEPDAELLDFWGTQLDARSLAEKASDVADEQEAVEFLASTHLAGRGGDEPRPISSHILEALRPDNEAARDRLENFGLRVGSVRGKAGEPLGFGKFVPGQPIYLAIADRHEALTKIFRDKRWSNGVWAQAFRRVPGAHRRVKVRFAGSSTWATLIPVQAIVETKPEPTDLEASAER